MKSLGRFKVLFLLIFFMTAYCRSAENVPVMLREPLASAMQATGAEISTVSVNGWGKLPVNSASEAELIKMIQQTMEKLGIAEYSVTTTTTRYQNLARAESLIEGTHITVIAEQLNPVTKGKPTEVYLVVNVEVQTQDERTIKTLNTKISKIMTEFGATGQITTCLLGWLDGKLMKDERDKRLDDAFASINAVKISVSTNDQYISATGFSPLIDTKMQIGRNEVNMNMALRYSSYEHRTYVIIGSPVITTEY